MTPARTVQNAGDAQNASAQHVTNAHDPAGRPAARGLAALGAIALGVGGALAVPAAASAAPAPCEQAQRYAAQSGAELFRLNKLDAGRRDDSAAASADVGVAEAKSALVAAATVNSAAVTRLLDADGQPTLSKPVIQQAPPPHAKAATKTLPKGAAGPLALGRGTLTSRATWDPRMACGAASGGVTRAESAVADVGIGELVRVPKKARSLSTTAMEPGARTVASAGLTLRSIDLLAGAVRVKVVRQPALTARMSTKDDGGIRYTPPVLEVSGDGITTHRLDAAGDFVELALSDDDAEDTTDSGTRRARGTGSAAAEPGSGESDASAALASDPASVVPRSAGAALDTGSDADAPARNADGTGPAHPGTAATSKTKPAGAGASRSMLGAPEAAKSSPGHAGASKSAPGHAPASNSPASDAGASKSAPRDAGTSKSTLSGVGASKSALGNAGASKSAPGDLGASKSASGDPRTSRSARGGAGTGSDSSATPPRPEPRGEPATHAGALDGLLSGLPKLGDLTGGSPLPLPTVPGVPPVGGPAESAPAAGPGTRMRISLGDLRQAASGRAIAAKATAIKVTITEGPTDGYGGTGPNHSGVVLDLDVGLLEAAAVAPEPAAGVQGAVAVGGKGGSLPITGPGAGAIAAGGVTLLLAGVAALAIGLRRRRVRP